MKPDSKLDQAMQRLAQFEEWTGTKAPCAITEGTGNDRTFAHDFLVYANANGLNLDWLWLGEVRGLVLAYHQRTKETSIMALYRRYAEITEAANAYVYTEADGGNEDEVSHRLFYAERDQLEKQMMALPAVSAQDMAAKALVSHCHGDFTCLHYDTDPFWIEARALVGGAA